MMNKKPLYRNFRESFARDFYLPLSKVIAAPVVTVEGKYAKAGDEAPQNMILEVSADLSAVYGGSETLLYDILDATRRTLPVLKISDAGTIAPLKKFINENYLADATLCADYDDRTLLAEAYEKLPFLRCMADCRGKAPAISDPAALAGELVSYGITMAILPRELATREAIHALQQRFIHVWVEEGDDPIAAVTSGANGVITVDPGRCYRLLESFPENTFLRRRNLIAHKGFQNNGMFSENTISGVVAAGKYGFDGAEIDIKLTEDRKVIVMHNLNTKGLFDCEEKVIEESDYAELEPLRRIGFENEGVDLFEDLMKAMRDYPDTPVLIEFKPSEKYHRVEEIVGLSREILARPDVQKNCIGIMGELLPGLGYVHSVLPDLPLSHCEGMKIAPPESREEVEERLYRFVLHTRGWAAGYNPEDVMINRLFNEYAKMRGITVFPWSRSWTLNPSRWEVNGRSNDATYMAGYDAWTTDHGDMYLHLPVSLSAEKKISLPRDKNGEKIEAFATGHYRDRHTERLAAEFIPLEKPADTSGATPLRGVLCVKLDLHFGDSYFICSGPVEVCFE